MIRIQFKDKKEVSEKEFPFYDGTINGMKEVICKDISSDPMNDSKFLLRFGKKICIEVNYKLIKHIGV